MNNLSARALIVLVALGGVVCDTTEVPGKEGSAKGRLLSGLLGGLGGGGGGAKHYGYRPQGVGIIPFQFGQSALPPPGDDIVKYKVYTSKSKHNPLLTASATKLKGMEKKFTPGAPIKLIISDWMYEDSSQLVPAQNIKNDYISKNVSDNIIIADWGGIGSFYEPNEKALEAVKKAGKKITDFINILIKDELLKGLKDLHIIGMGGGAHVAANIAHRLKKNNTENISRITALDPTGPGFKNAGDSKLDSSNADFVDVWHCNHPEQQFGFGYGIGAGKERYMGMLDAVGTMDIFINGGFKQPGCDGFMGHLDACSHTRCFDLFALTLKGLNLTGCECEDLGTFQTGSCDCKDGPLIGDATPKNTTGTYYLKTKANFNTKIEKPKSKDSKPNSNEDVKDKKKSEEEKD